MAALRLEQEAAALAIAALVAARGSLAGAPKPSEAWTLLEELSLPDPPPSLGTARALLETDDPLAFEGFDVARARRARAEIAPTLAWLLELAEPRGETELRVTRALRIGTLALSLAGSVWLVLWLFVWPSNQAAARPVAMSSLVRGSPPTEILTDGKLEGPLAVSERQHEPWARVDLLNPVVIERVVVHTGRETTLPLVLELSDDDRRFREAAKLLEPSAKGRFIVGLGHERARFLRLRHPGEGVLALGEIEVWGKR